jgi:transposase-like protein
MVLSQYIPETKSILMKCPHCSSEQSQKNGHRQGRQNYRCKNCGRQFVESYLQRGYSSDAKQICVRMYRAGLTLRKIERLTGISHSSIYSWVKQELSQSPDSNFDNTFGNIDLRK